MLSCPVYRQIPRAGVRNGHLPRVVHMHTASEHPSLVVRLGWRENRLASAPPRCELPLDGCISSAISHPTAHVPTRCLPIASLLDSTDKIGGMSWSLDCSTVRRDRSSLPVSRPLGSVDSLQSRLTCCRRNHMETGSCALHCAWWSQPAPGFLTWTSSTLSNHRYGLIRIAVAEVRFPGRFTVSPAGEI